MKLGLMVFVPTIFASPNSNAAHSARFSLATRSQARPGRLNPPLEQEQPEAQRKQIYNSAMDVLFYILVELQ